MVSAEARTREELALRLFELDQELRVDRQPPLSAMEWGAKQQERLRVLALLGWRPNEGS
jgi:hypothetical protein